MKKLNEDYLTNELKNGRNINIALLSHNAYWSEIMRLDNHFENCNVIVCGGSMTYIEVSSSEKYNEIENCNLIILQSSKEYKEYEMQSLKNMATDISNKKNRKISIGYSYFIPNEQRLDNNSLEQIKIIIFDAGEIIMEEVFSADDLTTYDLINLTLFITDNYIAQNKQLSLKK